MRLGKHQLSTLRGLCSPTLFQIVPDKVTISLERLGLVKGQGRKREEGQRAFVQITPKGLRTIADLWEAKVIEFKLPPAKKRTKRPSISLLPR